MRKITVIGFLLLLGIGINAQEHRIDSINTEKYTFGDFFDAVELPAMFGVGFSPFGIESAALVTTVRVGWRYHKVYGVFAGIVYESHIHAYKDIYMLETNIRSGDIAYNDVGVFAGYRLPLVKNIKDFYQSPRHVPCNMYISLQPTLTIPDIMHVTMVDNCTEEKVDVSHSSVGLIPSIKFNVGFEWFIMERFSLSTELGYLQHCIPTVLEQAAIDAGLIATAAGQMNVGIALSVLFK